MTVTVGVLALQGAFLEHLILLKKSAHYLKQHDGTQVSFEFTEVRNADQLARCDALIIPGGESTTISFVAQQSSLLEPLREFVKYAISRPSMSRFFDTDRSTIRVNRKPTWGTCAGLILLAEAANATKKGGQELIGGLDVRVNRNHFGRQVESFQADLDLPFLRSEDSISTGPFPGVFIRAPVVEKILPNVEGIQKGEQQISETVVAPSKTAKDEHARLAMSTHVDIMGKLPGRLKKAAAMGAEVHAGQEVGDIIAVKQGNVFGTSFHPELTSDIRIHVWWLRHVLAAMTD